MTTAQPKIHSHSVLGTAEAYFVCHIGPKFQISLMYALGVRSPCKLSLDVCREVSFKVESRTWMPYLDSIHCDSLHLLSGFSPLKIN